MKWWLVLGLCLITGCKQVRKEPVQPAVIIVPQVVIKYLAVCSWDFPIYWSKADLLTPDTRAQIEYHNNLGHKHCAWNPSKYAKSKK